MKKSIYSLVLIMMIVIFASCSVESVDEHYSKSSSNTTLGEKTATLVISCRSVFDNSDKADGSINIEKIIPKDGYFIKHMTVTINENETAFSLIERITRSEKIAFDYEKGEYGEYIKGIGNLYTGNYGKNSGWLYEVNGKSPDVGCGSYKVQENDKIEFIYVCDYNEYYAD